MPLIDNHVLDGLPAHATTTTAPVGSRGGARASCALPWARTRPPEWVFRRAELLAEDDRTLFRMCVRENASLQGLSRVLGVSAGTLSRRLQRIMARLGDPLVTALLDEHCPLEPELRQVGVEHFLAGLSARDVADKHRLTPRRVAKMLEFVRGWHASTRRPTAARVTAPAPRTNGTHPAGRANGAHKNGSNGHATPHAPGVARHALARAARRRG